ncbi:MAG: hypothetical protein WBG62_05120, partial [Cyclobacteriaceae bacterium]
MNYKERYADGRLREFTALYKSDTDKSEETDFLSLKVHSELGDWDTYLHTLDYLTNKASESAAIKARLEKDYFMFATQTQTRQSALQLIDTCEHLLSQTDDTSLLLYIHKVRLRTKMSMLVLGLIDYRTKALVLQEGLEVVDKHIHEAHDEALGILELVLSHSLQIPCPDPSFCLQQLHKYVGDQYEQIHDHLVSPFVLLAAEATLKSAYADRTELAESTGLPSELNSLIKITDKRGLVSCEPQLRLLFGRHLLDLELIEGLDIMVCSLSALWSLGYEKEVLSSQHTIRTWLHSRAQFSLLRKHEPKLQYQSTYNFPLPISERQHILHKAHQYFIEADYAGAARYCKEMLQHVELGALKVSLLSLYVNSATKIVTDTSELVHMLNEQIEALKETGETVFLAQLYAFKAELFSVAVDESYEEAIRIYLEIGDKNEAITQIINRGHKHINRNRLAGNIAIDEPFESYIKEIEALLSQKSCVKNPYSLYGSVLQLIGTAQSIDGYIHQSIETYKKALSYFDQAANIQTSTTNRHLLGYSLIALGRKTRDIQYYKEAEKLFKEGLDAYNEAAGAEGEEQFVDFTWRLRFGLALAYYEPFRDGLVTDSEERRRYAKQAEVYIRTAFERFSIIFNKTRILNSLSGRLSASGRINEEVGQLIFTGFYFYALTDQYEECIYWLENVR